MSVMPGILGLSFLGDTDRDESDSMEALTAVSRQGVLYIRILSIYNKLEWCRHHTNLVLLRY